MPTIAESLAALQSAALRGESVDVAAYAKAKTALAAEKLLAEVRADVDRDRDSAERAARSDQANAEREAQVNALIDRARKV
uniref:Uncharacterized protein n=1 Tax=Rhodococcus aetherivorans I24 TaxID=1036179 RepID=Q157F4_9NOCA|nr:head completion/stabilization protein [Rhodococcus aetherivorans]ABG29059.1 hypothetical protein [Rhodococcus aetherivorans I24]